MKRSTVTESRVRAMIFNLSNRLRRDPGLIYQFDASTRIVLMQVMVDPSGSWDKLYRWAKSSEEIPTWEDLLEIAKENSINVLELCRIQGWKMEELEGVYHKIRGWREDIRGEGHG